MAVAAPPADPTGQDPFTGARLECDIVMKGGITSGVVYPGAVLALATTYRFRSIGGASAGAIAAAVVAAAEHRRDRHGTGDGFTVVREMSTTLARPAADGGPFMLQLFQADPPTRPLFRALVGFMQLSRPRAIARALWAFRRFPLLALAIAVVSITLSAAFGVEPAFAVVGVVLAAVVLVVGPLLDAKKVVERLPENDFGLCRLGPDAAPESTPALTGWLHGRIQAAAGADAPSPLTFADLWGVPRSPEGDARAERLRDASREPRRRRTDLQMMTTDLTHGRPVRLPVSYRMFEDELEEGAGLFFDPEELEHFFPPDVMGHLVDHAPRTGPESARHLGRHEHGRRLRHFPIGPDLPVVVATRMSLSFPFLISAIPLWELDYERDPEAPPLRRVYFSDGGITSNFPVHFFDSPLPTRPTFGLHLTGFEPGEEPAVKTVDNAIEPPPRPQQPAPEPTNAIVGLGSFVGALKDATQNWRDNAQARLPGFRERIVHIRLGAKEGGLNLTMGEQAIAELNRRGAWAGEALVEAFTGDSADPAGDGPNPAAHWNSHRFARYRIALSGLDRLLRTFRRGYGEPVGDGDDRTVGYADRARLGDQAPYAFGDGRVQVARERAEAYVAMVDGWGEESLDDDGVPRPPSTLRAVPPV